MRLSRCNLLVLCLVLTWSRALSAASPPALFEPLGKSWVVRSGGRFLRISSRNVHIGAPGIDLIWIGAREGALRGDEPTGGFSHYLVGSDPTQWRTSVPHYSRVTARALYPSTDVTYYSRGEFAEFDVTLHPGANSKTVKFTFSGATHAAVEADGQLEIDAGGRQFTLRPPHAYQLRGTEQEPVGCRYTVDARGRVGFRLGRFDRRRDVVIDPVVAFSTYLGGSGIDQIEAVGADLAGNVIVAGVTNSPNFPGGGVSASGTMSIFVTKLNPTGSAVLFTTLLGARPGANASNPLDGVSSLAVDVAGSIYVTGHTATSTYPTTAGAWQQNTLGSFLTRLDNAGKIIYSTFLGPSNWKLSAKRVRARNGIAYLAGTASAPEFFGTSGAVQRSLAGGSDFYAIAMAPDGSAPLFATAFGGSGVETLADMDLDAAGNLVLVGMSASSDFPLSADALPYPIPPTGCAVLVRIDSTGSRIASSTGLGALTVLGIAAVPDGGVVVAGAPSLPADLITSAPHASIALSAQNSKAYLAKFPAASNRPVWTTDISSGESFSWGISADQQGNIYWAGYPGTASGGAIAVSSGNGVTKLSADGSRLLFASPLPVFAQSMTAATEPGGSIVIGGSTAGGLTTTPGVVQAQRDPAPVGTSASPLNANDGFVIVFDLSGFSGTNFFAIPPQFPFSVNWRIGEPAPAPLTQPLLFTGIPTGISVTPSSRLTASYSASPSPVVSIGANTTQAVAGTYQESVSIQSLADAIMALTIPVTLVVRPAVSFDVASTQVTIRYRHGQQHGPTYDAITPHLGTEYFNYSVKSSGFGWLFGSVNASSPGGLALSIDTADTQPGTYDGDLTVSLDGLQNVYQVVHVHCIIDPAATIQLSTTEIVLHVVKGQPIVPAVASVTGSLPGVQWGIFVGVSRTWLQVTQTTTATPGEIHVTVDPATLEVGYWAFTVFVSGEAGQRLVATILVDVSSGAPLDALPTSISAQFMRGAGYLNQGQIISLNTPSPATVRWTADSWIQASTGSIKTPANLELSFDTSLPEGVYSGKITFTTGSTSVTIPVAWSVYDMPHLVFSAAPISFQWRIGEPPPPAVKLSVTCPTLKPDYFSAGATNYPSFLKVDPSYGPTPATLTLTVDTTALTAGSYTTNLSIQGNYPDSSRYAWIPVTLTVLPDPNAPKATVAQVTDAASFLAGAVSPGEAVVLFGKGLGPTATTVAPVGANGRYPQSLAGWTVYFDELAAPILYLSDKQSAVMVPFGIAGRTSTKLTVSTGGTLSTPLAIPVSSANPAIFTADSSGSGIAAAVNVASDGSISPHAASTPARRGGIVTFYAAGLGVTTPAMQDGSLAGSPLPVLSTPVRVLLGGTAVNALYAGPAPGLVSGLTQINIQIPGNAPTGLVPLLILSGESPSQPGVRLAIQ
jgi:uncharacterized protein (TIGR03437 family)